MIVTAIITLLTFAGAVCGVWGLGESENVCKYDYKGDNDNADIHN
jgi:hypothetical protein